MVRISEVSSYWMEDDCPMVSVSGTWLKDFGFAQGRKIVVEVTDGQMIIKAVDGEEMGGMAI